MVPLTSTLAWGFALDPKKKAYITLLDAVELDFRYIFIFIHRTGFKNQ